MEEEMEQQLEAELQELDKTKQENGERIRDIESFLNSETRDKAILDSLSFSNKIMVTDDGQMVAISRILLPEYAKAKEIHFRPTLDRDGFGISTHIFETDDNE